MQAHATARPPGDDPEMPSHAQTALIPMPSGRGVRGSTGASLGLGRGPGGRPRAVKTSLILLLIRRPVLQAGSKETSGDPPSAWGVLGVMGEWSGRGVALGSSALF